MALALKTDAQGVPEKAQDGKLIFIDSEGQKEVSIDVDQLFVKINELNSESKTRRLKLDELNAKYKPFEDITDLSEYRQKADAALKALADGGDPASREALKKQIAASFEQKIADLQAAAEGIKTEGQAAIEAKTAVIRKLLISSEFAKDKLFSGEDPLTFLTPDMAESIWGNQFKVEEINGSYQAVGYNKRGEQILSRERPGEPASFGEAIAKILDEYPNKERIMRSPSGGSGSSGGEKTGNAGGSEAALRTQYANAKKTGNVAVMMHVKEQLTRLGISII